MLARKIFAHLSNFESLYSRFVMGDVSISGLFL